MSIDLVLFDKEAIRPFCFDGLVLNLILPSGVSCEVVLSKKQRPTLLYYKQLLTNLRQCDSDWRSPLRSAYAEKLL